MSVPLLETRDLKKYFKVADGEPAGEVKHTSTVSGSNDAPE